MSKTFEHLFCSVELTGTTHTPLICLAVINILLSVAAFMENLLILVALGKESPLHPPSKLLLRSLATTDLFVGVVAEPLVVVYWMSVVKQNWHFCRYAQSAVYLAGHVLCSVSLLTLTTIAVERLQSRPAIGSEIRASCNTKTDLYNVDGIVDFLYFRFSFVLCGLPHNFTDWLHRVFPLYYDFIFLLRKNFLLFAYEPT